MTKPKPSANVKPIVWSKYTNPQKLGIAIRALKPDAIALEKNFHAAFDHSKKSGSLYTAALVKSVKTKKKFIEEGTLLFKASQKLTPVHRKAYINGFVGEAGKAGSLFLLQNMSGLKRKDARNYMSDFLEEGGSPKDIAHWLQLSGKVLKKHKIKNSDTAEVVVDAIGDAADWIVDALEDGVDAILEGIDAIIDAFTTAGGAIIDLFEEVVSWTADQIGSLLRALVEAGRQLGEFIGAAFDWAYSAVATFVEAAFEVGFTIANILENVVSETYFVFRRFINGILVNLGPLGDILDFALDQFENGVANLWRETLLAARFAEASLLDALDWMATQTQEVINEIIAAWESIGENLIELYEWALDAGAAVWQAIGEATATIGNSIYYAYNFLRTTGVEFIFDFTRGLLRAGQAVASIIGWAVDQTIEVCGEVIRGLLDAGVTIGEMIVDAIANPGDALNILLGGLQEIGDNMGNILVAAFEDTVAEFSDKVMETLIEIGNAVVDILMAALDVVGSLVANVIASLCNLLGTYRSLTDAEIADARTVFGNSLDYELIFLSNEDPLNAIIFGIQDFFTKEPDSRAFVTNNLINFDVGDGEIDRTTLIHELTHVWQHREIGSIYMARAIWAQIDGGPGYNYGYLENNEFIGNGNGVRTNMNRVITAPVSPGSLEIVDSTGAFSPATDDGLGNISNGDNSITGTVNYITGQINLSFTTPPADGSRFDVSRTVTINNERDGSTTDFNEGPMTGTGGETALNDAAGDFSVFNEEQQGQIMMHWFVRNRLQTTGGFTGTVINYNDDAWQPYRDFVRAS